MYLPQREGLKEGDPSEVVPRKGKVILEVNMKSSRLWDLNRPGGVYQLLLWAASEGRITDVVGSPPHDTWPTARTPLRGPKSYPRRTTAEPYGRDGLPPLQQQRLNEETSYVAKQLMLWMVAMVSGNGNVGFLMCRIADRDWLFGQCRLVKEGRTSVVDQLAATQMVEVEDLEALPSTTDADGTVAWAKKFEQVGTPAYTAVLNAALDGIGTNSNTGLLFLEANLVVDDGFQAGWM